MRTCKFGGGGGYRRQEKRGWEVRIPEWQEVAETEKNML